MTDINDPRFHAVLRLDDPDFAAKFRDAIGLKPGERLEITTPQFERTDGNPIAYVPSEPEAFAALKMLNRAQRKAIGMAPWEERPEGELWLFPKEWYASIPAGTEIVDINYQSEQFEAGKTDDDYRFGMLAFGFVFREGAGER